MPAPIVLNSGNAQFQGRNIYDGSIDDTQAGGEAAASTNKCVRSPWICRLTRARSWPSRRRHNSQWAAPFSALFGLSW